MTYKTAQYQSNYNKLTSVIQYLIWMTDSSSDQEYQNRKDTIKILRDAKQEVSKESGHSLSLELSWEYAEKWEDVSSYERVIKNRIREQLRPILQYV